MWHSGLLNDCHQGLSDSSQSIVHQIRARPGVKPDCQPVDCKSNAVPVCHYSLLAAIRRPEMTLHTFKRQLKAYLFHIMCWRIEGTFTTARRCCDVFVILAPDTKLQTYLLTYLHIPKNTYNKIKPIEVFPTYCVFD